jgi:hypothetical protein
MTLLFPNNSINALFSLLSLVLDFLLSLPQPSPIPQSLGIILPYPYHLIPPSHILITHFPIMVITGGYTVTPHHRQNRRRERPGSRTRRTITRKPSVQYDCAEGLLDARDNSVPLPSDKARPSPLLRQNFDQSWQCWKARQAEEKAIAVMDNVQLEQEQQRLFGGDFGDDDVSLIPAMLGVLERLFDGDLDYIDP